MSEKWFVFLAETVPTLVLAGVTVFAILADHHFTLAMAKLFRKRKKGKHEC